jgi:hypothetical protein
MPKAAACQSSCPGSILNNQPKGDFQMKYHDRTMSQSKNAWLLALVLMSLAITTTAPNTAGAQHTPVSPLSTVTQADAQKRYGA